jgi:hypothetical protein
MRVTGDLGSESRIDERAQADGSSLVTACLTLWFLNGLAAQTAASLSTSSKIGPHLRKIAEIDAEFGDQGPNFVHFDRGPGLRVQIYDWTFASWHSDSADSPAPKVILEYTDGTYGVSAHLTRSLQVDVKDIRAKIEKLRSLANGSHDGAWPDADVSSELRRTMLDLIYTGHRRLAYQFLEEAWPQNIRGKEVFRKDSNEQLKKSRYWKQFSNSMG